jgi:hypothetical protein
MFNIIDKITTALETKQRCTLIDKTGRYFHGTINDSWVRISAGKMRGKIVFASDEKGEIEVDANDILDLLLN